MTLEEQLLEITQINPKKFKDRQKLLEKMARVAVKLPDDKWDKLPDPLMTWADKAVEAIKAKKEIPDLPDAEAEEAEAEEIEIEYEPEEAEPPRDPDEDEPEDEPEDDEEGDEDAGEDAESDEEAEADDHEAAEAAADTAPTGDNGEAASDTVVPEGLDDIPEEPQPEKPQTKKKAKAKKEAKPKKEKVKPIEPPSAPRYENLSGNKNRYGFYEGTKADDAIKMLEKGCTQAEIKAELGDTKYNLERRLQNEGHTFEKKGSWRRLIHRDDFGEAEAKPKGKKK